MIFSYALTSTPLLSLMAFRWKKATVEFDTNMYIVTGYSRLCEEGNEQN